MKVYAFVPAKSSSIRIPGKNTRVLAGEPLYIRALKNLLHCNEIDRVFLDTDSKNMYEMANYLPIGFLNRDPSLCQNSADGHTIFINEVTSFPDADIYVQLLCTSPFISPSTIDSGIKILKTNSEYDSAILVRREKIYMWKDNEPVYGRDKIPNSVDMPEIIMESMGLYICRKQAALKYHSRYGVNPLFLTATPLEGVDINTPDDFKFAEIVARGIQQEEYSYFRTIAPVLNSALLSDTVDDLTLQYGEPCGEVLAGFECNLPTSKVLGRARCLKLRKLRPGEDFHGIYDALHTYAGMSENDIICVENECHEYAYFGDLNARLAIRAGAVAAIVNGKSRDCTATQALNFPVFCKGYTPKDVRRRATMEYADRPINFDGISISPGDLIFADNQSIVVIYPKHEQEVLSKALAAQRNEHGIAIDIARKSDVDNLSKLYGDF